MVCVCVMCVPAQSVSLLRIHRFNSVTIVGVSGSTGFLVIAMRQYVGEHTSIIPSVYLNENNWRVRALS